MNPKCLGEPSSLQAGGGEGSTSISALHEDIIQTHILTRLNGPALASVGCASSQLHALSTHDKLWQRICNETWPSTADPTIHRLNSTMSAGHRSFYYDCFPTLQHYRRSSTTRHGTHKFTRAPELSKENLHLCHPPTPSGLFSAVDIRYQNKLILSKIHETETKSGWFLCSPFRVDLLDPKDTISSSPEKFHGSEEALQSELANNLALSWILIDPTRKRAANFSSLRPVSVTRHWLTADVQVRYATVLLESLLCTVVVTCGRDLLQLKEVSLQMEDMEGRNLSGEKSLVILQELMESGERRKKVGDEREIRYVKFLRMKREMRERKQRRERLLDLVCIAAGVTILVAWVGFLLRTYIYI